MGRRVLYLQPKETKKNYDDVESWGNNGFSNENDDFEDVWDGEIEEKVMKGAMNNDDYEESWEDKRCFLNQKNNNKK